MLKQILCDWLGWHRITRYGHNGCNAVGVCRRCDQRCLQDSNGDWFVAKPSAQRSAS